MVGRCFFFFSMEITGRTGLDQTSEYMAKIILNKSGIRRDIWVIKSPYITNNWEKIYDTVYGEIFDIKHRNVVIDYHDDLIQIRFLSLSGHDPTCNMRLDLNGGQKILDLT